MSKKRGVDGTRSSEDERQRYQDEREERSLRLVAAELSIRMRRRAKTSRCSDVKSKQEPARISIQ